MPKSSFRVPNPLGKQAARTVLESFMPQVGERFKDMIKDVTQSWNGDALSFSFRTMGMSVSGSLTLSDTEVDVQIEIPFGLMMVKGRIEQEFKAGLGRVLAGPRS